MKDFNDSIKYANISRRSFLKGALAVGGALALAGCQPETVTNTVTVTDTKTVTVTDTKTVVNTVVNTVTNTVTVTESAPIAPTPDQPVQNMITSPSTIIPQYTICEGCNLCMIACSFKHGGNADLQYANIQVYGIDIKGGMVDIPVLCMHCNDTPCLAACPPKVNAISVDEVTGALKIDHDKCTLCELCIEACNKDRTGTLRLSREGDKVLGLCDLCDGNPECVQICPGNVLRIQPKTLPGEHWAQKPWEIAEDVWKVLYR